MLTQCPKDLGRANLPNITPECHQFCLRPVFQNLPNIEIEPKLNRHFASSLQE